MSTPFYVVFDGMPGPYPNDCCFVETETEDGRGLGSDVTGGWSDHAHDGNLARLGPFVKATPLTLNAAALLAFIARWREDIGYPLNTGATWARHFDEEAKAIIAQAGG